MADEFDVGIKVTAEDRASATADKISNAFKHTSESVGKTQAKIESFAKSAAIGGLAAIGVGWGFKELYDKALNANLALDKVRDSLTGVLFAHQGWVKGVGSLDKMNESMRQSAEVAKQLEEQEDRLALPLEELAGTYRTAAGIGFSQLGMMKDGVMDLTVKAAEMGKVLGMSGESIVHTMGRAINSGIVNRRSTDPFNQLLVSWVGNAKKLSSEQMWQKIKKGMSDISPAAERMSQSFGGTLFRMRDTMEHLFRDLSSPSFEYITKKLEGIRAWMDKTTASGKSNITVWGEKLLWVVKKIESASKFIYEHWKLIAGIYVGSKILGFAASHMGKGSVLGGVLGKGGVGEEGSSVSTMNVGVLNVGKMGAGHGGGNDGKNPLLPEGVSEGLWGGFAKKAAEFAGPVVMKWLAANITGPGMAAVAGSASLLGGVTAGGAALGYGIGNPNAARDMNDVMSGNKQKELAAGMNVLFESTRKIQESRYNEGKESGVPMSFGMSKEATVTSIDTPLRIAQSLIGLSKGVELDDNQVAFLGERMGAAMGDTAGLVAYREKVLGMPQDTGLINKDMVSVQMQVAREQIALIQSLQKTTEEQFMTPWDGRPNPNVPKDKPAQIKATVNITQDFKEADPDRVFMRFKNDLEAAWGFQTQSANQPNTGI